MTISAFQISGGGPLGAARNMASYLPRDRKKEIEPVSRTKDALNQYGDHGRILPGNLGYGTDINYSRLDDLDNATIEFVRRVRTKNNRPPVGLDIGCGYGRMSVELALAGAHVLAIDLADTGSEMNRLFEDRNDAGENPHDGTIAFLQSDIKKLDLTAIISEPLDFVYSQRTLHYFEYDQSLKLLISLKNFMRKDGRIFISVSGKNTDLGQGYGHKHLPIDQRYAKLNRGDPNVYKHQIFQPVCLYSLDELSELFRLAGFRSIDVFESAFGNIKGIFSA